MGWKRRCCWGGGGGGDLLCRLTLVLGFLLPACRTRLYTNHWAVRITGGLTEANRIASKYGYVNIGQVTLLTTTSERGGGPAPAARPAGRRAGRQGPLPPPCAARGRGKGRAAPRPPHDPGPAAGPAAAAGRPAKLPPRTTPSVPVPLAPASRRRPAEVMRGGRYGGAGPAPRRRGRGRGGGGSAPSAARCGAGRGPRRRPRAGGGGPGKGRRGGRGGCSSGALPAAALPPPAAELRDPRRAPSCRALKSLKKKTNPNTPVREELVLQRAPVSSAARTWQPRPPARRGGRPDPPSGGCGGGGGVRKEKVAGVAPWAAAGVPRGRGARPRGPGPPRGCPRVGAVPPAAAAPAAVPQPTRFPPGWL